LLEPLLLPLERVPSQLSSLAEGRGRSIAVAGTAADTLIPLLHSAGFAPADSGIRQPDAIFVAQLAAGAEPGAPPKPLYLRPPDAKLPQPS
jgi:hypothetical protein